MPLVQLVEGRGGAARHGGHRLSTAGADPVAVPDELVRRACEAAVVAARGFEAGAVPGAIRPYLKMHRLPAAALRKVRRVLEEDPSFRSAVAALVTEESVGRGGFLFLTRPEGWTAELGELAAEASSVWSAEAEDRAERAAGRRAAAMEARLADLQRRLDAAAAAAASAESRVAAERERRSAAEAEVASLAAQVEALRHERDDARVRVVRAEARAAEAEAALADAVAEVAAAAPPPPPPPPPPATAAAGPDVTALSRAVSDAAAAADALRGALADAASLLAPPPLPPPPAPAPASGRTSAYDRARRRPAPLPGGVLADSTHAAEHLVRLPGAVLLVDGYNCTLRDDVLAPLPIPEQRRRLLDALTGLAARTGVDVEVVFDGGDVASTPVPAGAGRRGVRVRFSAPGVEADDDVIARVAELPPDRPVVVASSDRRVRDGAAAAGANVISAEQLIGLVRSRR